MNATVSKLLEKKEYVAAFILSLLLAVSTLFGFLVFLVKDAKRIEKEHSISITRITNIYQVKYDSVRTIDQNKYESELLGQRTRDRAEIDELKNAVNLIREGSTVNNKQATANNTISRKTGRVVKDIKNVIKDTQ